MVRQPSISGFSQDKLILTPGILLFKFCGFRPRDHVLHNLALHRVVCVFLISHYIIMGGSRSVSSCVEHISLNGLYET